jgi:subtilisin family serine protease
VQALNGRVIETSKAAATAVVVIDRSRIEDLARLSGVKMIEPAPPPKQKLNDGTRRNMGTDLVSGAPLNLNGTGVKAGIWDGGTVANHDDFKDRLTIVDIHIGADAHATHVAGTMGGSGIRSKSVSDEQQLVETLTLSGHEASVAAATPAVTSAAERSGAGPLVPTPSGTEMQWRGVAPGMQIFSYFWDNPTDAHEGAIKTHGIQLSQNSWSFTVSAGLGTCNLYGEYTIDSSTYDDIIIGLFGTRIPVVFAAGNERNDEDCGLSPVPPFVNYGNIPPPATAKNMIAVGAINSNDDSMTEFSSWGPTKDGRLKPDIVAPGCEATGDRVITSTAPGNGYGGMCGTSMAAPAVSGTIALLIQQQSKLAGSTSLLPSSIKAALIHGAGDLHTPGPDFRTGYGKVAIKPSVELVRDRKITEGRIATSGQMQNASLNVPDGTEELKVTLVWDDARGSASAAVALVNDLDLQLVSPSGRIHQPFVLDPANPDKAAATGVDHRNVVEQVLVTNPEKGAWTIQVRGFAVPVPPQPFSLAVTTR